MKATRATIENALRLQVDELTTVEEGLPDGSKPLSPFLNSAFDYYFVNTADSEFVAASPKGDEKTTGLANRLSALQQALDAPAVLYAQSLPSPTKRELIGKRQGFITANGDLYLPHISLALSSATDGVTTLPGPFTPSEQAVFLYCLYCEDRTITQNAIQEQLGMSPASTSRALSSLCTRKLLDYEIGGMTGRQKTYLIHDKRRYYREGIQYFGNPIAKRFLASLAAYDEQPLFCGLTALSVQSNLTKPAKDVVAVSFEESKAIERSEGLAMGQEKRYEVQVLRYDPTPLSLMVWQGTICTDPVTMLLSIDERDKDERVSIALRELMAGKGYTWYTD